MNGITFTGTTIAKLDKNKKCNATFQGIGCLLGFLTIGHFIWIVRLRSRHEGRVVSGDFLGDDATDITEANYLISHGMFALVYIILTFAVTVIACCGMCIAGCYITAKTAKEATK